jgi:hypothetical protein
VSAVPGLWLYIGTSEVTSIVATGMVNDNPVLPWDPLVMRLTRAGWLERDANSERTIQFSRIEGANILLAFRTGAVNVVCSHRVVK